MIDWLKHWIVYPLVAVFCATALTVLIGGAFVAVFLSQIP